MTIELSTKRDLLRGVLKRYERQYDMSNKNYRLSDGRSPIDVANQLELIDLETCEESEIHAVLKSRSWTSNDCEECQTDNERIVFIGGDDERIGLCRSCLVKAIDVIDGR